MYVFLQQRSQYGEHIPQNASPVVAHIDDDSFDLLVEHELVHIFTIDLLRFTCFGILRVVRFRYLFDDCEVAESQVKDIIVDNVGEQMIKVGFGVVVDELVVVCDAPRCFQLVAIHLEAFAGDIQKEVFPL